MKVVLGFLIAVLCLGAATLSAQGSGLADTTVRDTVMSEYQAGYAEGLKHGGSQIVGLLNGCGGALAGGGIGWNIAPLSIRAVKIGSAIGGGSLACLGYCIPGDPEHVPEGSPTYKRGFVNGYKKRTRIRNLRNGMISTVIAGTCSYFLLREMLRDISW